MTKRSAPSSPSRESYDTSSHRPNAMWGGHFAQGPAEIMARINVCLEADQHLWREDIEASKAHVAMLSACGLMNAQDAAAITAGLESIQREIADGAFVFRPELEDIHMNVEARLIEMIGEVGGRLHTARSRNDQVATDLRLWTRNALDRLCGKVEALQRALVGQARAHAGTIMPGYTHLQPAQPVTFGHHLLAYTEMVARDRSRLRDARARLNESPLGAAALAGTSFPIDRAYTAHALAFARPMANSLDAVGSRDFVLEVLAALSILGTHLSRLAEEIILWTSDAFRFVALPESLTTGSSIMPQKRNPDAAELSRAKVGALMAAFTQVLIAMKGLPLAYNKDLQETKVPLFHAVADTDLMLEAMTHMVSALQVKSEAMLQATQTGFLTATDLADYLVRALGMPFRNAHHVTGQLVKRAEERGCRLDELSLRDLKEVEPRLTAEARSVLDVHAAVASRTSYGGTAPVRVMEQVCAWESVLGI